MVRRVAIKGRIGDWTAEVEGRRLAVIHTTWRTGYFDYCDPMVDAKIDGKKYAKYRNALESEDLVVVQKDKFGTLRRDGYDGVYRFKDLKIELGTGVVRLSLTELYARAK